MYRRSAIHRHYTGLLVGLVMTGSWACQRSAPGSESPTTTGNSAVQIPGAEQPMPQPDLENLSPPEDCRSTPGQQAWWVAFHPPTGDGPRMMELLIRHPQAGQLLAKASTALVASEKTVYTRLKGDSAIRLIALSTANTNNISAGALFCLTLPTGGPDPVLDLAGSSFAPSSIPVSEQTISLHAVAAEAP